MNTYIKRPHGGYYAMTTEGMVTVERRYEFTNPTRDWVARFRGETEIGTSREDAVERVLTAVADKAAQEDAPEQTQQEAAAELFGPSIEEPAIEQDLPQVENRRTVNQVAAVVRTLQRKLDKLARESGVADFAFQVTGYGRDAISITLSQDGAQVASVAAPENTTAPELYQLGYRIHRDALARVIQAWLAEPAPQLAQPTRTDRRAAAIEQAQQEDRAAAHDMKAARRWVNECYEGSASCNTWTDAQVLDFVEDQHVNGLSAFRLEAPRVLSPMDRDRQVRRIMAELGGNGRNTWLDREDAQEMAQALYDAGFRATDPAGFGN